jgi:hypothetical protein
MNKIKYGFVNGDNVIALVYDSEEYGRTLVVLEKLDVNFNIQLIEVDTGKPVEDKSLVEFLQSMIPNKKREIL